jgi:hypothetical protein
LPLAEGAAPAVLGFALATAEIVADGRRTPDRAAGD